MRANGVPEDLITGAASSDYDKFLAYARTVPHTLRNPLHHWSHLELRRYFNIDLLINEQNAPKIWKLSYAEISKVLKTSVGGLKANYFHALRKVQEYLKDET